MVDSSVHRQVLLLAGAQALFQTVSVMVMTVGGDLAIFVIGLLCSLGAGALLQGFGWQTLNLLLLPWLCAAALALIGLAVTRRYGSNRAAVTN